MDFLRGAVKQKAVGEIKWEKKEFNVVDGPQMEGKSASGSVGALVTVKESRGRGGWGVVVGGDTISNRAKTCPAVCGYSVEIEREREKKTGLVSLQKDESLRAPHESRGSGATLVIYNDFDKGGKTWLSAERWRPHKKNQVWV